MDGVLHRSLEKLAVHRDDVCYLIWYLWFYELSKKRQRFLPPQIAGLGGNGFGDAFLDKGQLGPTKYLFYGNRRLHFSWKIRVVELIRMLDELMRNKLKIFSTERMTFTSREVRK